METQIIENYNAVVEVKNLYYYEQRTCESIKLDRKSGEKIRFRFVCKISN